MTAERLAQSFADPEPLGLPLGRREVDARGGDARALAALLQLADQASGVVDARLRLRRPRLRAAAQPLHLAAHQIGQRLPIRRLVLQQRVARLQEVAVAAGGLQQAVRIDAVQLEHAPRDVLQEIAVVADDDERLRLAFQERLEPENGVDVEMIGGLIEQQDVGLQRQLARDGQALAPAAGQGIGGERTVGEAGLTERAADPRRRFVFVERGRAAQRVGQDVLDRHAGREDGVLRDVADANALAHGARAGVGLLDAGENLQQRRFPRTIRPHQSDVIALRDGEAEVLEKWPRRERLRQRLAGEQNGGGHR